MLPDNLSSFVACRLVQLLLVGVQLVHSCTRLAGLIALQVDLDAFTTCRRLHQSLPRHLHALVRPSMPKFPAKQPWCCCSRRRRVAHDLCCLRSLQRGGDSRYVLHACVLPVRPCLEVCGRGAGSSWAGRATGAQVLEVGFCVNVSTVILAAPHVRHTHLLRCVVCSRARRACAFCNPLRGLHLWNSRYCLYAVAGR